MRHFLTVFQNIRYSKWFIRFFLSTIIISLLVTSLLSCFVYSNFLLKQRDNIIQNEIQQIETVSKNVNNLLNELLRIVININKNAEFSYYPSENPQIENNIITELLNDYSIGNRFISDIGYYRIFEPDEIFSSQGKFKLDMFSKYIYNLEWFDNKELPDLPNRETMCMIPIDKINYTNPKKVIAVIYGLPLATDIPKRYVIFFIDHTQFNTIITDILSEEGYNLHIFNNQKAIYSLKETDEKYSEQLFSKIKEKQVYEDKNTMYMSIGSDYIDWKFVVEYDKTILLKDYAFNRNLMIIVVICVSLLIIILSIIIAFYNYKPLYSLFYRLSKDEILKRRKNSFDEIAYIERVVDNQINKKKMLEQYLFLSNLILDQFDSDENIQLAMQETDINFHFDSFCCCAVYYIQKQTENEPQAEILISGIETLLDSNMMRAMCVDLCDKSCIAILVNYSNKIIDFDKQIKSIFEMLISDAGENYNCKMSVGISNPCQSLMQVSQAYENARQAAFFSVFNGEHVFNYSNMNIANSDDILKSYRCLINKCIKQGNSTQLLEKVNEYAQEFKQKCAGKISIDYAYSTILEYLIVLSDSMNINCEHQVIKNCKRLLSNPLTKIDIKKNIEDLCNYICSIAEPIETEKQNLALKEKILNIIDTNLCDNTLSLIKIASECNITPSYLIRYFKSQTGSSPMQYVDYKRMELAKSMLLTTSDTLKQIVAACGYIDESNFIRKFKKIEQVTPMKYRKDNMLQD